jgi:hypothetical protein
MDRIKNITSTIRIKVEELNKEVIIVIRENEPSEHIIIDYAGKDSVEKLNSFVEFENLFNIPCEYIEL